MPTFAITTLGCKVNQYESEQIASLLRRRGWQQIAEPAGADLRIVNTCSVTMQAAGKSRQTVRRMTRAASARSLPVLHSVATGDHAAGQIPTSVGDTTASDGFVQSPSILPEPAIGTTAPFASDRSPARGRVIVTGCWATSNPVEAKALAGVDAVLGHHEDVAAELGQLLTRWEQDLARDPASPRTVRNAPLFLSPANPGEGQGEGSARSPIDLLSTSTTPHPHPHPLPEYREGEENMQSPAGMEGEEALKMPAAIAKDEIEQMTAPIAEIESSAQLTIRGRSRIFSAPGTTNLPQLDARHTGHQRAFLKVQDGCDAHCTYCIIPSLRPSLWSKTPDDAVEEANRLVAAGHAEIVLTGIFLGAYGQPTALRRRQVEASGQPLGRLIEALCTRVPGLRRLRLSSLEPGDLGEPLLAMLGSFPQVVPHFHLPLQSGSDLLLHRMNRQYTRDDFLRMVDAVHRHFDRPAITTDIIVGFPGETEKEFSKTLDVVDRVRFIHTHAFSYSPRPGTAAVRWLKDFVRGPIVNQRIEILRRRAADHSFAYRQQFVGETVELLVERPGSEEAEFQPLAGYQHGRCERYFAVHFESDRPRTGEAVRVLIDRVTPHRTIATVV